MPKPKVEYGEELGKVKLTEMSEIIVKRTTYNGISGVDIRIWVKSPNYVGHTIKGIALPLDKLQELKEILNRV